jgi:hypothetical protein
VSLASLNAAAQVLPKSANSASFEPLCGARCLEMGSAIDLVAPANMKSAFSDILVQATVLICEVVIVILRQNHCVSVVSYDTYFVRDRSHPHLDGYSGVLTSFLGRLGVCDDVCGASFPAPPTLAFLCRQP